MEVYENDIEKVVNSLEHIQNFLQGLFGDRMLLKKALLKMMLDQGIYDLTLSREDAESTDGYHISYDVVNDDIKFSIKFPKQGE